MTRVGLLSLCLCVAGAGVLGTPSAARAQKPEPLEGIALEDYVRVWPPLQECTAWLTNGDRRHATYCVDGMIHNGVASGGANNLKAQLLREDGNLDAAAAAIERALRLEPNQDLHHFQSGQISVARVALASNPLTRWRWAEAAYASYDRAFNLDTKVYRYRKYVATHKLRAPAIGGGDKEGALALADQGITYGCQECYMLRGYAQFILEQFDKGFADFDKAVSLGLYDHQLLLRAGQQAVDRQDWTRADRYYRYILSRRPDSARAHFAMGSYLAKKGDAKQAAASFEAALKLEPDHRPAAEQLAHLRAGR